MCLRKTLSLLSLSLMTLTAPTAKGQKSDEPDKDTAMDTLWKKGAILNLNFSQVALENWTGGGQNSISATGAANLFADYRKGKISWQNSLDMAYGMLSQRKDPFIKNDDKIQLNSKIGRKIRKNFFYSAQLNLRSQFAPGYSFPTKDSVLISDLLSPGYGKGGLGIGYNPSDHFDLTAAPLATKVTVVANDELASQGAYGVEPGENVRYELGGNLTARISKTILPNTELRSDISLFSNYLEEPGNIDINFSLLLNMKINSFMRASISTDMIYDDDIMVPVDTDEDGIADKRGPRLQIKEVFNLGLSFDLGNTE